MQSFAELYEKFDRKIWVTTGARFNASRRLISKQNLSIFTISMLALCNMMMGFPLLLSIKTPEGNNLVTEFSVVVSIFVLIISLLEASKGYELKAERLHRNAMDLNKLYGDLLIGKAKDADPTPLIQSYYSIIESCPENHSTYDASLFKAQNRKDFNLNCAEAIWIKMQFFVATYSFYILLLTLPLLFLVFKIAGFPQ